MALAHRWSSRNLSRLELVSAILVIALLVGTFLERGLRVFAIAEERALQATILNMNSVLRVMFYQLAMSDRAAEVEHWQGANPIALLGGSGVSLKTETVTAHPELARFNAVTASFGASYRGEFDEADPESIEPGQWYFHRGDSVLVYRVRNTEFFRSPLPGTPRIRFRLNVQYNPASESPVDVVIRPVDQYQWIEAGVKT
jgi:hypothetical protein